MADRPIIKIAIDAEDFDAFADRFNAYREKLRNQPEEWKATNEEIKEMKENFEDAAETNEIVHVESTQIGLQRLKHTVHIDATGSRFLPV